jgi:sortase A
VSRDRCRCGSAALLSYGALVLAARILGIIGRIMVAAGVLLLLFVAYQLWGTGIEARAAQRRHAVEFEQRLAQTEVRPTTTTTVEGKPAPEDDDPPEPVAPAEPVEPEPVLELEPPEMGEPMARIQIPAIGVDQIVLSGVEMWVVNEGPGHFPSTSLPGQPGNSAIAGHRTTFGAPFHRLDELDPGDEVLITTVQGEFRYEIIAQPGPTEDEVRGHYIVDPYAFEILDDKGDDRVTLMACHPKYSAAERIIVEAVLLDEPAPPTPRPETDDREQVELTGLLVETDSGAWFPSIMWSLLAGAIWFGAWLLGRAWRRWPSYLLATPVFALVLFVAFQNISRLLPAGY